MGAASHKCNAACETCDATKDQTIFANAGRAYSHATALDSCGPLSARNSDSGSESPYSQSATNVVENLPGCLDTTDAHVIVGEPNEHESKTVACEPVVLTVTLDEKYQLGQAIVADGPHGKIRFNHPGAKVGDTLNFALCPPADMTITVPKGYQKGDQLFFDRWDGVRIAVSVPGNLAPGNKFDVIPPALMVKAPEGAQEGDPVVFRSTGDEPVWLRASVPKNLETHRYFAARLPVDCHFQGTNEASDVESDSDESD